MSHMNESCLTSKICNRVTYDTRFLLPTKSSWMRELSPCEIEFVIKRCAECEQSVTRRCPLCAFKPEERVRKEMRHLRKEWLSNEWDASSFQVIMWVRRGCTRFQITSLYCLKAKWTPPMICYPGPDPPGPDRTLKLVPISSLWIS